MTDQTSETTPDGLDVAAVRERMEAATEGGCGCPDSRDCCERDADLTPIDGGFATEGEA